MSSNLEIARQMAANGWPVAPAPVGKKIHRGICPLCQRGDAREYDFDRLFAGISPNTNVGIHTGQIDGVTRIAVLDFDANGPAPNVITLFENLLKESPEIFEGCVIERTARAGIHAYYRSPGDLRESVMVPWIGLNKVWGCSVAVMTEHNTTCWPSYTAGGDAKTVPGAYVVISKNGFLDTRPEDLPLLPELFRPDLAPEECTVPLEYVMGSGPIMWAEWMHGRPSTGLFKDEPLGPEDLPAIINGLVEFYARYAVASNDFAIDFVRHLTGLSRDGVLTPLKARRALDVFCSRVRWVEPMLPRNEIFKRGMANPEVLPFVWWPRVRDERWKRLQKANHDHSDKTAQDAPISRGETPKNTQ